MVPSMFTIARNARASFAWYRVAMPIVLDDSADDAAPQTPYLHDRAAFDDAAGLIARFGDDAGFEAAALAERSRNLGNAIGFCRWRQIERLIVILGTGQSFGTVH